MGQYFKWEGKYALGHECSMKEIHMIKGVEEDKEFLDVKEGNNNWITNKLGRSMSMKS